MAACERPIDVFQHSAGRAFLVPCSKCSACLERKRQGWILRAQHACKDFKHRYFITLTYDDAHLPYESFSQRKHGAPVNPVSTGESVLCPYDLRLFFERFRVFSGEKFAYFAAGEYGSEDNTRRPHYHICFYCNLNWSDTLFYTRLAWSRLRPETTAERLERYRKSRKLGHKIKRDAKDMHNRIPYGRDKVESLTYKRITYVSKYVTKQIGSNEVVPCFYRCSNGLGKSFFESVECAQIVSQNLHYAHLQSGRPCALPRYYSKKMFNAEQMDAFQILMISEGSIPLELLGNTEAIKIWLSDKENRIRCKRRRRLLFMQGITIV